MADNRAVIVSIAYAVFNILIIAMILIEPKEQARKSGALATILDFIYAILTNMWLQVTALWTPYTYSTCVLLYFIFIVAYVRYKVMYYVIGVFSAIFTVHMIHVFNSDYTPQNKTFIALSLFTTILIFYLAKIKEE
jgi:hypothetical protein